MENIQSIDARVAQQKLLSGDYTISANRKGKSDVWRNFGFVKDESGKILSFVACKACKQVYSHSRGNGTSTLKHHQCKGASTSSSKAHTSQPNSNIFRPRTTITTCTMDEKDKVTAAAAEWITSDLRPFNTIQGKGHRNYIQKVSFHLYNNI